MCTYSRNRRGRTVGFVFIGIAGAALLTALLMVLWNWLIPAVLSGPIITYWQAAGILILSKILFSGFWGHKHPRPDYRHRDWRKRFEEKMKNMSEEDREKFKSRFHHWSRRHEPCSGKKPEDKTEKENQD